VQSVRRESPGPQSTCSAPAETSQAASAALSRARKRPVLGFALSALGLLIGAGMPAQASTIAPNTIGALPDIILSLPATADATITKNLVESDGLGAFPSSVSVTENVYLNQTNGGITGTLFAYQVTNGTVGGGNDPIRRITMTQYPLFAGNPDMDVGYSLGNGGTQAPSTVDWTNVIASKGTVGFNFAGVLPGSTTFYLYIQTAAPTFTNNGSTSGIDGGTTASAGFYSPAVPGPIVGAGFPRLGRGTRRVGGPGAPPSESRSDFSLTAIANVPAPGPAHLRFNSSVRDLVCPPRRLRRAYRRRRRH
jgi:hypothetical protein